MRLAPWIRDPHLWLFLGATLLGLLLAWSVKAPCFSEPWTGQQYTRACYNDIQPLYGVRHQDVDAIPYVDMRLDPGDDPNDLQARYGFLEYPVLTGLVMHLAARLSTTADGFLLWNVVFLSAFALATTVVLYRTVDDRRYVALWALGPPLVLYAFHNWDLIAVFFAVLGLHYFRRGNALGTGVALALGASAKLFPAFLAPALGIAILARERRLGPQSWRFGLGFFGAALLVNGPFLLLNRELFLETYRFHLRRTPNFETLWYVLGHFGREWDVQWMQDWAGSPERSNDLVGLLLLVMLGVMAFVLVLVWRGRLGAEHGAFACLLLFMVTNKIFSVQYALWVLPFFALLALRHYKFALFCLADLTVYVSIFTFFAHIDGPDQADYFQWVGIGVVARAAMLVWLLVDAVRARKPLSAPLTPPARTTPLVASAQREGQGADQD